MTLSARIGDRGAKSAHSCDRLDRGPREILEALRDPVIFSAVRVAPELGTVVWPNGADLDPLVLHEAVERRARPPRSG